MLRRINTSHALGIRKWKFRWIRKPFGVTLPFDRCWWTRTGTAEPYPDFDGRESISGAYDSVDGVSYFQLSETGYVEGGNTDVFELRPEGTVKKFHLSGGFLLGMDRIR